MDSEVIMKDNLGVISWEKGYPQKVRAQRWQLQNHNMSISIFLSQRTLLR